MFGVEVRRGKESFLRRKPERSVRQLNCRCSRWSNAQEAVLGGTNGIQNISPIDSQAADNTEHPSDLFLSLELSVVPPPTSLQLPSDQTKTMVFHNPYIRSGECPPRQTERRFVGVPAAVSCRRVRENSLLIKSLRESL